MRTTSDIPGAPRVYACVLAPGLPLQALRRTDPALAEAPLAVVAGAGTRAVVTHAARAALAAGVAAGMTPVQARSVAPGVVLRTVSARVLDAARRTLIDVALGFSPHVAPCGMDAVVLDARGTGAMFPTPGALGAAIEAAAARAGLTVRVGIAAGPRLARMAARSGPGVTVLAPGAETAAVGGLPIAILDPSPRLAETLAGLGVTTVARLAALGRGLGVRLGPEGVDLQALARGLDRAPLEPLPHEESFVEAVDLDWTLDRLEPLAFLLSAAVERLVLRLEARRLVPSALSLSLDLDPAGVHVVGGRPAAPTRDLRSLVDLLRRAVDASPPPAPVRGFSLSASGDRVIAAQGDLFGPPMPDPGALGELLGRLGMLAGPDAVGAPAASDAGDRVAGGLAPFAPRPLPQARPGIGGRPPVLALRRFADPPAVAVREQGGLPIALSGAGLSGPIVRAAGPWYVDAAWWTDRPVAGAFWDVEVPGRGLYRLWHDLAQDRWFVEGGLD